MKATFVKNGNESIEVFSRLPIVSSEKRDAEWFKHQLQIRRLGQLEIAWGDYLVHFNEVPSHVMEHYLALRSTCFHRKALEQALLKYQEDTKLSS